MATFNLTTTPTQIDDGTSYMVQVTNTGGSQVILSRGGTLWPGQLVEVYPEGAAVTAATSTSIGSVSTSTTSAPLPNAADPTALAANAAFTGKYARLLTTDATSTSASGTLTAWHLTPVDATSAPATWTLPAANSVTAGGETAIKKADASANTVTVTRGGSDLIFGTGSGSTSKTLTLAGEAVTFVSNGVDRWTIQTSDTPSGVLASTYLTQVSATSTYEPLGGLSNHLPMRWLGKKVSAIKSGTTARVKWLYFGDSYGNKIQAQVVGILENALGKRAGYAAGGSLGAQITINSTSGTVTGNTADFTLWPTGQTSTLGSAGASMTFGVGGVSFTCDTIKVIHANAGGGFKIQVDGVDNTTPTVTSDNSITITTISVSRAAHTVSVVQTSGSPKIVGIAMEDSTLSGAYFIAAYQGGIGLDSPTTQAWTNWSTFLANLQPDVITFEMKEGASTLSASLDSFLTATQAGWPSCDVVLIQSPPQSTNNTDLVAQNTIIRTKATTYSVLTWDSYTPFGSYANLVALGWNGDGTHVANDADLFRGLLMLRDLGILTTARYEPLDVNAANGYFSSQVTLGTTAGANGKLNVINTDMAVDLARAVQFRTADGSTTFCILDSRNGSGNPSTLPQFSEFGSGNAGIVGVSANEVSVRKFASSNLNSKGYLSAANFLPTKATQTLASNGAVTFTVDNGQTQRVALQANATSSTITSPLTDGQMLTIQWAQDATGGRTYSWPSTTRFAGGSAPSDTTASTITTVNFVFDNTSGKWVEISRAVAVPTT